MNKIGFWEVSTTDLEEILSHYNVKLQDIDVSELDRLVNESLKDPDAGCGDPWRMGLEFHIARALKVINPAGYNGAGKSEALKSETADEGGSCAPAIAPGYRPLTLDERIHNFKLISLTVLLLLAITVFFVWMYKHDYLTEKNAFLVPLCTYAVLYKTLTLYVYRFNSKYNITRLVVCVVALCSTLIYRIADAMHWLVCRVVEVSCMRFALFVCAICVAIKIFCYILLNRTSDVHKAKIIGWVQAFAVTFIIGTYFFGCIAK